MTIQAFWKKFITLILFSLLYFILSPLAFNHAHAADECAKAGFLPKCEQEGSTSDRWILYPRNPHDTQSVGSQIGNAACKATLGLFGGSCKDKKKISCDYPKTGESHQCAQGQVCNNNGGKPACVGNAQIPQDCTCDKKSKDLMHCNKPNPQDVKCVNDQECTGGAGKAKCASNLGVCTCDNPGQKGDGKNKYTCKRGTKETKKAACLRSDEPCTNNPKDVSDPTHPGVTCDTSDVACSQKDAKCGVGHATCCGEMSCYIKTGDKDPKCHDGLPDPPSPPCAQGAFKNGKCTAVPTAFGNISTDPAGFIKSLFAILLSLSGGIALLLIIKAGYVIITANGKPEAIQQGRDQLIAAIVGLIFLIFSFVILQTIGVDILHIPGFK